MSTVRIQVRRGLASEWTAANPVLAAGEMGVETNTNKFKFGNGSSTWTALSYAAADTAAIGEISQDAIDQALSMGAGLTKTYNDGTNTITITVDTDVISTKTFATSEANTKSAAAQAAAIAAAEDYTDAAISGVNNSLEDYIPVSDRGAQNGVASLDANTKIPVAQIALNNFTSAIHTTANISGDTITGVNLVAENLLTANDVNINGNLTVSGTSTTVNSTNVSYDDPMIYIGDGNQSNVLDVGVVGAFNNGTYQHTGLVRDASDGIWKLFSGVVAEPTTTVDFTTYTRAPLEVGQIFASGAQIGAVSPQQIQMLSDVTSNIQAQIDTKLNVVPDASVTTVKLADSSVSTDKIIAESITTAKIAPDAVTSAKIANDSVSTNKIADSAVSENKIADSAVTNNKIAANAVNTAKIANNSVTTAKIEDSAVTENKIANLSVSTNKIADEAVTTAKIADGSVNSDKIEDGSIVTAKVSSQAITVDKISDDSITNAKISPTAEIAQSKIAGLAEDLDLLATKEGPTFTGLVVLPSSTTIGDVDATEISYLNGVTSSIQTQFGSAATALSTHSADTTDVHGIADTSLLATKSYADAIGTTATDALALKAPLADPTFTGTVVLPAVTAGGSVIPSTDNTYDLGSPTKMWKDIYVGPGSLYVNGQKVLQDESGAIVVSADVDENLGLRTSGSGNIELDPTGTGSVNIKGPLVVEAGANFSSADGNGIAFSNGIKSDLIASKTLNTDLSLSGNGTGKVYLNDNAEVNGNLVVGGNLTVSGTTTSVNTETISLADNIIDLNSNFTTGSPTENSGIRIVRGDSNAVQLRWNESTDKWEFTNDGTNYSVIAPTDSPTFTGTVTIPAGASISGFAPLNAPTFTGTVTVAASGIAFTDGTQTREGVPSRTVIGTAIAGAYNLSTGGLGLRDQLIPVSGAHTITVPANATTAYPVGTSISFYQSAGADAVFAEAAGVTILRTPGLKLRALHSSATITKVATDTWLLAGDLKA
jgi:hypothetical protein